MRLFSDEEIRPASFPLDNFRVAHEINGYSAHLCAKDIIRKHQENSLFPFPKIL